MGSWGTSVREHCVHQHLLLQIFALINFLRLFLWFLQELLKSTEWLFFGLFLKTPFEAYDVRNP